MTRVAPPSGERVEQTPRVRLTPAQRKELLSRQDYRCAQCRLPLRFWLDEQPGQILYLPMIDEHIIPLWAGGSNDLSNRALYCVDCAKAKTKREATARGKVNRLIKSADPSTRKPSRLRGRGFDRSKTRRFDGTVVPRA